MDKKHKLARTIAELFEDGLHDNDITVYCADEEEQMDWEDCDGYGATGMYGSEYDELVTDIEAVLTNASTQPANSPAEVDAVRKNICTQSVDVMRKFYEAHVSQFKGGPRSNEIGDIIEAHLTVLSDTTLMIAIITSGFLAEWR